MPATPGVTVNATLLAVEAIQPVTAPVASVAPGKGRTTSVVTVAGVAPPAVNATVGAVAKSAAVTDTVNVLTAVVFPASVVVTTIVKADAAPIA